MAAHERALSADGWRIEAPQGSNSLLVESMVRAHNAAIDRFAPYHLELGFTTDPARGLVTGDNPMVITKPPMIQLGVQHGLALGDAELIYMPLARRVTASFTPRRDRSERSILCMCVHSTV